MSVPLLLLSLLQAPACPNALKVDAAPCSSDCEVLVDEALPSRAEIYDEPGALAVDGAGQPRVVLTSGAPEELRLAERGAAGWSRVKLPEADMAGLPPTCGGAVAVLQTVDGKVGLYARGEKGYRRADELSAGFEGYAVNPFAVWVDAAGRAHLGLTDGNSAPASGRFENGKGTVTSLKEAAAGSSPPSVAVAPSGAAHLAWFAAGPNGSAAYWAAPPGAPELAADASPDDAAPYLAISREGGLERPHLFFSSHDAEGQTLKHASRGANGKWTVETVARVSSATSEQLYALGLVAADAHVRMVYTRTVMRTAYRGDPEEGGELSTEERDVVLLEIAWPEKGGIGKRLVLTPRSPDRPLVALDRAGKIHLIVGAALGLGNYGPGMRGRTPPAVPSARHLVIGRR
jgi:hypothetical protein